MSVAQEILNDSFGGRRLIIRGAGPSCTRVHALKKRYPDAALWTFNDYWDPREESDAHWEIHTPRHHGPWPNVRCPVFVNPKAKPAAKNEYPLPYAPSPASCQLAWLLAYAFALTPRVVRVHLAGVDYLFEGRESQLPSVNYWLGAFHGRGCPAEIPAESRVLSYFPDYE